MGSSRTIGNMSLNRLVSCEFCCSDVTIKAPEFRRNDFEIAATRWFRFRGSELKMRIISQYIWSKSFHVRGKKKKCSFEVQTVCGIETENQFTSDNLH
jgi:hypothetical protein